MDGIFEKHWKKKLMMNIDLEELKKEKEANFKERLDFIDRYLEWKPHQIKYGSKQ